MFKTKHGLLALSVGRVFIVAVFAVGVPGCGGGGSSTTTPPQTVTVAVTSSGSSVLLGNMQQFTAKVTGTSSTAVSWSVNGISGGNTALGTISSTGLYTAPQDLPTPPNVTREWQRSSNYRQRHLSKCRSQSLDHFVGVSRGNSSTARHNQQRRTPRRQGKLGGQRCGEWKFGRGNDCRHMCRNSFVYCS
jgi:hypothetical protein